jgi:FtsZ-binding cell division protein ZapB
MAETTTSQPKKAARPAVRSFTIGLACVAIMGVTMVYAGYGDRLISIGKTVAGFLFHPIAIVLLVSLGMEYIVLKSADRSRLLQLELDRLREKRRGELTRLRQTREGLDRIKKQLEDPAVDPQAIRAEVGGVIDNLRPPEAHLLGETPEAAE